MQSKIRKSDSETRGSSKSRWKGTIPAEWEQCLQSISTLVGAVSGKQGWTDTRPFVSVTLLSQTFRALIDSRVMVNLIGDQVVGIVESRVIRPKDAAVELRIADGSTCQSRNRYRLIGLVGYSYKTCI